MYKNSNFVFILIIKIRKKTPWKVGYFSKIAEIVSTAGPETKIQIMFYKSN
jgi:hypothetical protein